jgi:4'-phosphopantetheinyl transferase
MDPSAAAVGIDFSFSHSGDFCACAISDFKVGIDIQEKTHRMPLTSSHVFTEKEALAVSSAEDFLRYWTCKESFMKALGLGLSLELNSFAVIPGEEVPLAQNADARPWQLRSLRDGENFIALCGLTCVADTPLVRVDFNEVDA